jgi:hypothetical protein
MRVLLLAANTERINMPAPPPGAAMVATFDRASRSAAACSSGSTRTSVCTEKPVCR